VVAIWKSATKQTPVTELVTPYLKNCIAKVERELADPAVTDRAGKTAILEALRAEFATRTDA
jgi:hypothetical protein